jgi:hypothetical protein
LAALNTPDPTHRERARTILTTACRALHDILATES